MSTREELLTPATNDEKCRERAENPEILEEIEVEELAIDGICGVY